MPPEIVDWATENNRFSCPPMCTNLTGECARKFLAKLLATGGDKVEVDIDSGRAMRDFSPGEIANWSR